MLFSIYALVLNPWRTLASQLQLVEKAELEADWLHTVENKRLDLDHTITALAKFEYFLTVLLFCE